ncbi:MAG: pilus assembly protein [Deltaproteobacteria bacterium]|nr:pilus assembly protein [Deltaproteobacteria bacterium]
MNILKNTKGIAMVEGVIVIPVFIIIWMGMYGLHSVYSAKISAQNMASATVMRSAQNGNCSDKVVEVEGADGNIPLEKLDEDNESFLDKIGQTSPLVLVHTSAEGKSESKMFNEKSTQKGSRIMACNSKPADNLLDMVADRIKGILRL